MAYGPQPGSPAVLSKFGPYYESAIRKQLPQREAVGQAPLSASELAGVTYGELQARYEQDRSRQEMLTRQKMEQQRLDMEKENMKREEQANKARGMGAIGGVLGYVIGGPLGGAIGSLLGGVVGGSK